MLYNITYTAIVAIAKFTGGGQSYSLAVHSVQSVEAASGVGGGRRGDGICNFSVTASDVFIVWFPDPAPCIGCPFVSAHVTTDCAATARETGCEENNLAATWVRRLTLCLHVCRS